MLGHRRLAIIDLSPRAHQPMSDRSKTAWLVYNGEIYNYRELRAQLQKLGHSFYSESDTEVLLASYKEWGGECVQRLNGMFTFAIWDDARDTLLLARDRFGVKPLYYHMAGRRLLFGSEVSALIELGVKPKVDLLALDEYFTFQNILSDRTLFEGVKLLPPGTRLEVHVGADGALKTTTTKYWDYKFSSAGFAMSEQETADRLLELFVQAVNRQLVSDVPLGSYLSGGMDSGSITRLASEHFGRLASFTVGFDLSSVSGLELGFDERKHSEFLANLLKTEHYEAVLHAGDMEAVMPDLIRHLEDLRVGQCYPNYYAARLAGKFVKVVLSGAGGDELFGGYPWRYYNGVGAADRGDYLRSYYSYWQRLVPDEAKPALWSSGVGRELADHSTFDVFASVFDGFPFEESQGKDWIDASLYFEIKTFLHGLLVVEDKISMAHSLETRVPFLDNDLVDFAMQVPNRYKLRDAGKAQGVDENELGKVGRQGMRTSEGKNILRKAMLELMPRQIVERRKQGFSAPDATWFRGESIDYIESILSKDGDPALYEYLNPRYVAERLREHAAGKSNHRLLIWSLLSFEWWCRSFL
jgi:asparagine synthase (glutamine-hydrolysing)